MSRSVEVYRALLRLLPTGFRQRFGDDMVADFTRLLDRSRDEGRAFRAWRIGVRDVLRTALVERGLARRDLAARAGRGIRWQWRNDAMMQDLRYSVRTLRRNPAFTLVTALVMALGIGSTTVIFSAVDGVVLRPLPYPDADRIVAFYELNAQGDDFSMSQPDFVDFRDRTRVFSHLAAYSNESMSLLGDEAEQVNALVTSRDVFDVLGTEPMLGRTFRQEEDAPGAGARVVILDEGLWTRRFGGDRSIVGRAIRLDGEPYEVIGVMPTMLAFPGPTDVYVPLAADPTYRRGDRRLRAVGRLTAGVSIEQADADAKRVASSLASEYAATNGGWSARVVSLRDDVLGPSLPRTLAVLLAGVGLLLLLACANVSNLLVVRATSRRQALSVRIALGASRARIARQLLTESLVLGALGGVGGVLVALAGLPVLRRFAPAGIPRIEEIAVDARMLAFAFVASLVSALLFGLVPVLQALRGKGEDPLRAGGRTESRGVRRTRDVLVIAELTLATVLLVGAALLIESFRRLETVDVGYTTENALAIPVSLTGPRYSPCGGNTRQAACGSVDVSDARAAFIRTVSDRIATIPGVRAVGATSQTPLAGTSTEQGMNIEGRPANDVADEHRADWRAVSADWFDAARVRIVQGRAFTSAEEESGAPYVLVSESAAKRFWPGENAIGRRLGFGARSTNWLTVIGITADIRDVELTADASTPMVYVPFAPGWWPYMTLIVSTRGRPEPLADEIRAAIHAVDATLPVPGIRTLTSWRSQSVASQRFAMILMSLFAAMALTLSTLGVYGVTMFSVSRRLREIGLRIALGAERRAVVGMVVRHGLVLAIAGTAVGSVAALALARFIAAILYETPTTALTPYALVMAVLLVVAMLASLIPAIRAARVDPRVALAEE